MGAGGTPEVPAVVERLLTQHRVVWVGQCGAQQLGGLPQRGRLDPQLSGEVHAHLHGRPHHLDLDVLSDVEGVAFAKREGVDVDQTHALGGAGVLGVYLHPLDLREECPELGFDGLPVLLARVGVAQGAVGEVAPEHDRRVGRRRGRELVRIHRLELVVAVLGERQDREALAVFGLESVENRCALCRVEERASGQEGEQ